MRKTKIICTLGPATENLSEKLIKNGMDAARVNFSHETYEIHKNRIKALKKARNKLNKPIPIIMDTKGSEIRTGIMKKKVFLKNGQEFKLITEDIIGDRHKVSINPGECLKKINISNKILIDDGKIKLKVKEILDKEAICEVISGGFLSDKKGVNIPDCNLGLSPFTKKDKKDIKFALKQGIDYIALSFVKTRKEIDSVRELLKTENSEKVKIIAKIENRQAINNVDSIIDAADGIMVARGDLGAELSLSEVPGVQKRLIRKCYLRGKPVITATQMMESMIENPVPTRAEASDVANAVYDGTSVVMLSGETAAGDYPIKALKTLVNIIKYTEEDIHYQERFKKEDWFFEKNIVNTIGKSTTSAAFELKAKAITVSTRSGNSARMISRFRPDVPIVAVTINPRIERQLNLSWGIYPVKTEFIEEVEELFQELITCTRKTEIVKDGDLIIFIAGIPTGVKGSTNMMKIHRIGDDVITHNF